MKSHTKKRFAMIFVLMLLVVSFFVVPSLFAVALPLAYTESGTLSSARSFNPPTIAGHGHCGPTSTSTTYYTSVSFYVDASGPVTMDVSAFGTGLNDARMFLYVDGFNPGSSQANCNIAAYSTHGTPHIVIMAEPGKTYTMVVTSSHATTAATYTMNIRGDVNIIAPEPTANEAGIHDGRINNKDAGPIAVYPDNAGGIHIYSPEGVILLAVSAAEFDAVGIPTDKNVIIKEENGIQVIRLTTGEYQVNAYTWEGKLYTFVFDAPYAGAPYTSWES